MYYLKCENCSHPSEVKNEYLNFCDGCGKKLAQNFQDWKKTSEGTFEDYKSQVCIAGPASTSTITLEEDRPKNRALRIALYSILYLGILGGVVLIKIQATKYLTGLTAQGAHNQNLMLLLDRPWERVPCGGLGLSIETPVELTPTTVQADLLPEEVKRLVEDLKSYTGVVGSQLLIMTNSVKYKPEVTVDIRNAAAGSLLEVQKKPGVTDLTFEVSEVQLSGKEGIRHKGSYTNGDQRIGFYHIVLGEGTTLWEVWVNYDALSDAEPLAEKVIGSIEVR